jgi:hypothetical protein
MSMTQVVERLPSKHKALNSNPTTVKKKKKGESEANIMAGSE